MDSTAQRRPGREPRRHSDCRARLLDGYDRSTKAGARTPATRPSSGGSPVSTTAQRRPGREPRRHATSRGPPPPLPRPLNEGRGANPGDTLPDDGVGDRRLHRSTKAGARTPATLAWLGIVDEGDPDAQRRPGREPRRHLDDEEARPRSGARSTKAGARTPATLGSGAVEGGRDVARSTKAGARTPATRDSSMDSRHQEPPLNEGRGANPGDTRSPWLGGSDGPPRSTKAGARTPATHAASGEARR